MIEFKLTNECVSKMDKWRRVFFIDENDKDREIYLPSSLAVVPTREKEFGTFAKNSKVKTYKKYKHLYFPLSWLKVCFKDIERRKIFEKFDEIFKREYIFNITMDKSNNN